MATGATETRLEVTVSESPGRRRQGKFQPFRRLFGKRKKRAAEKSFDAAEFKASFSTEEVCNGVVSDDEETNQHLREPSTAGNRALSHDSVFIPEEPAQEGGPEQTMSQENVSDKVRSLQRQIGQNIKFGQKPPSQRKSEGEEGSSDEEDAPRSPLKVLAQVEAEPDEAEPKVQGAEQRHGTPVKSPRSKRMLPATGTIESINLDSVPQSVPRLDNTAAKHKLAVKPKNQRVSRKHRRFTQELSPLDVPPEVKEGDGEDAEATGTSADARRRTPGSSDDDYGSLEGSKKQRIQEAEGRESRRERERDEERMRAIEKEEEEERRRRQQEEARLRKEEEEEEERKREEAERRRKQEEDMRAREEEERAQREREERRVREEERRREEEEREREESRERLRLEEEGRLREEREEAERRTLETEKRLKEEEEERKRRSAAEELRWREMEERQRPFSFKVSSSGEKQILFQKVNLTPVDPTEGGGHAPKAPSSSSSSSPSRTADPPNLPSSQYVPHTAILVTGAQLCGPAVNLDQIKDPACKSLLGLGDDKKAMAAPMKSKTSPERKSGKTKSLNEASLSTDQSSAAILAEWASIRSKIFKGAEEGKNEDYPEPGGHSPIRNPSPGGAGENQTTAFPHTNLRKTMSASAKFSITPARKKFSDSKRNSELLSQEDGGKTEAGAASSGDDAPLQPAVQQQQPQGKVGKTVRVVAQRSEGCMFAKDLPSFLVPNATQGPADDEREDADDEDRRHGGGQDTPPPFGIKLRRTNYSLRFHGEQPTEKRKKRYSAGDSFEGVPSPLAPIEPESAVPTPALGDAPPGGGPASSPLRESRPANEHRTRAGKAPPSSAAAPCAAETPPAKPSSVYQKPGASSRPASGPPPPPPPLAKSGRGGGGEERERRGEETTSAVAQLQRSGQGEEEPREKKSFFPSISIPWREKPDRKTELARREKPSLQSRHSLDSVRGQDKEAGPMWVTLALQKQKGFREQQQSRDERRSQREAKLAEKQARDRDGSGLSSPSGSKGSGTSSPTPPPEPPHEAKRPDSLLGRFERREHLKKANTLPSSVTVEIADSTPSPPAVKEVSKRFPASDSPQVCTEPAWLALAKRKAKAWSDCPQIIK